jgi:hypothetical protein
LRFFENFDLPVDPPNPLSQQPALNGREFTFHGGKADLRDDLSERIAAADYVLTTIGIPNRREVVAEALNRSPMTRLSADFWGPEEVRDRVRAYQRRKHHRSPESLGGDWIGRFRWSEFVFANQPNRNDRDQTPKEKSASPLGPNGS